MIIRNDPEMKRLGPGRVPTNMNLSAPIALIKVPGLLYSLTEMS